MIRKGVEFIERQNSFSEASEGSPLTIQPSVGRKTGSVDHVTQNGSPGGRKVEPASHEKTSRALPDAGGPPSSLEFLRAFPNPRETDIGLLLAIEGLEGLLPIPFTLQGVHNPGAPSTLPRVSLMEAWKYAGPWHRESNSRG